jgi:flagellar biosynthesis/type III secretory pathway protein FliH
MQDFTTMTPPESGLFTAWSGPQARPQVLADEVQEPVIEPSPPSLAQQLEAARQAGRDEAEAAHQTSIATLKETAKTLTDAIEEVDTLRHRILRDNAEAVGDMITGIARRVLGSSLALHPDALPNLVRRAVEQMPAREGLTVSVPAAQAERIHRVVGAEMGIQVLPDIEIQDGCVVRSEGVSIESTVDIAIQGVEDAVSEWTKQQALPIHKPRSTP